MNLWKSCYYSGATAFTEAHFGAGTGDILLNNVQCTGSELRLVECPSDLSGRMCMHNRDIGARCESMLHVSLLFKNVINIKQDAR